MVVTRAQSSKMEKVNLDIIPSPDNRYSVEEESIVVQVPEFTEVNTDTGDHNVQDVEVPTVELDSPHVGDVVEEVDNDGETVSSNTGISGIVQGTCDPATDPVRSEPIASVSTSVAAFPIDLFRSMFDSLEQRLAQNLEKSCNQLEKKLTTNLENSNLNLEQKLNQIQNTNAEFEHRLTTSLESKFDKLESTVTSVNTRLDEVRSDFQGQMASLNQSLSNRIDSESQRVGVQLEEISEQVNAHETALATVSSELHQIESTVEKTSSQLESQVKEVEQCVDTLSEKFSNRIEDLNREVTNLSATQHEFQEIINEQNSDFTRTVGERIANFTETVSREIEAIKKKGTVSVPSPVPSSSVTVDLSTTESVESRSNPPVPVHTASDDVPGRAHTPPASSVSVTEEVNNTTNSQLASVVTSLLHRDLKLPVYYGTEDETQTHNFLVDLETYFELMGVASDYRLTFVSRVLRGVSLQWYKIVKSKITTHQEFLRAFREAYLSADRLESLRATLLTSVFDPRVHKTPNDYLLGQLQKNAILEPPLSDESLLKLLARQLPQYIRRLLIAAKPKTISEMLSVVSEIQLTHKDKDTFQQKRSVNMLEVNSDPDNSRRGGIKRKQTNRNKSKPYSRRPNDRPRNDNPRRNDSNRDNVASSPNRNVNRSGNTDSNGNRGGRGRGRNHQPPNRGRRQFDSDNQVHLLEAYDSREDDYRGMVPSTQDQVDLNVPRR